SVGRRMVGISFLDAATRDRLPGYRDPCPVATGVVGFTTRIVGWSSWANSLHPTAGHLDRRAVRVVATLRHRRPTELAAPGHVAPPVQDGRRRSRPRRIAASDRSSSGSEPEPTVREYFMIEP